MKHGLLMDTRLSREARLIGLYVASKGDGEHEIGHDEIRAMLGRGRGTSIPRVAASLRELDALGWVASVVVARGVWRCEFGVGCAPKRSRKIPQEIRDLILVPGSRCATCEAVDDLTIDHIVPFSHGGGHDPENLRVLCRTCNSSRGARV